MKIKQALLAFSALLVTVCGYSQHNFGIKAGYGIGNMKIESSDFQELIQGDNIQGFETGIFYNFQWPDLYFRPELLYMYRAGELRANAQSRISVNRLQIPLILGLHIVGLFG